MAKVVINVNMFDMYQQIYYIDNNNITRTTTVMTDNLVDYILYNDQWNKDVDEIEIDGNKSFIQKIGRDFIKKWQSQFSNRNVRILINGEVFN